MECAFRILEMREEQKQIPFGFAQGRRGTRNCDSRSFARLTPITLTCDRGPKRAEAQDDTTWEMES